MRKQMAYLLVLILSAVVSLTGCQPGGSQPSGTSNGKGDGKTVVVYNWTDYIAQEAIDQFEKETGYTVDYKRFTLNEDMYVKIKSGASAYDVAFPSDYMIERMIKENMVLPLDTSKLPNIKEISEWLRNPAYDAGGKYSVPYMWGTVGILYNMDKTGGPIDSWSAMWDTEFQKDVLMMNSPRDSIGIALKKLGYSINTRDINELKQAKDALIEQGTSGVRLGFGVDEIKDKMANNEAAMGLVWSGDAYNTCQINPTLAYCVPKEGSNLWFDGMVIPKTSHNQEGAHAFINFMMKPEIAAMNSEYIGFSTPNEGAKKLLPKEMMEDPTFNPPQDVIDRCEVMRDISDISEIYSELWTEVISH